MTIAFVGDIRSGIAEEGGPRFFASVAPEFNRADLVVANLETAAADGGTAADKQFTFRGSPSSVRLLHDAGIDVVSLANNHTLDYGPDALRQTIRAVHDAGLVGIGAGFDAQKAEQAVVIERRGIRVGFLAFSRVFPDRTWAAAARHAGVADGYDDERVVAAVRSLRRRADVVVVLMHWGTELSSSPRPIDRRLAGRLFSAGATAIIGGHPHVLQGFRWDRRGHFAAWSLGNFAFWAHTPVTAETGILELSFTRAAGVTSARFVPVVISGGRPLRAESSSPAVLARARALSAPEGTWVDATGDLARVR